MCRLLSIIILSVGLIYMNHQTNTSVFFIPSLVSHRWRYMIFRSRKGLISHGSRNFIPLHHCYSCGARLSAKVKTHAHARTTTLRWSEDKKNEASQAYVVPPSYLHWKIRSEKKIAQKMAPVRSLTAR